jgi:FAD/FMN-containing dehydrogenase/Fe-S oxidoreductase
MHASVGKRTPNGTAGFEHRLARALAGEARFDAPTRGLYATDASIYQIMPRGVVFPKSAEDIGTTLALAGEHGIPVIMRGAGTSQNGQPIGDGLIVECARYLDAVLDYDPAARRVRVQPGMVLERLNSRLRADGLFFPVEPSTASRCTIGGMAGNNSCGARSIFYGKMVDNVRAIAALDARGNALVFGKDAPATPLIQSMLDLAARERTEILARFPRVQRRVGGYNLDALLAPEPNPAHLLVGSEGTLAAFTAIDLALAPLPKHRVMGICHFPGFRQAMTMAQHLVALGPVAVELVDRNVLDLGADIPLFRETLAKITRGKPDCLLLVEFAGEDRASLDLALARLDTCMADHGFPRSVVAVTDIAIQKTVWEVREACLNIMMSMKGDGKPVSFIEDCAVPLESLADYTDAVSAVFEKHGTRGTWYAHASVGCLHVRPILNLKEADGVRKMRAIAEETGELVRRFKGSYSGEHGDGISRSEFIEPMFGAKLTRAFEAVKDAFDPKNCLNPGKIVRPLRFDNRTLMRYPPGYAASLPGPAALDWSAWGGFSGAVEMCNNNGTCRKAAGGAMCPSFRVTREEAHLTRGRANTLRLALSGQLGADGLDSDAVKAAMALCVGCKACQRECPTGVDMARMKIEYLHHRVRQEGIGLRERLIASLPRYAPYAARFAPILNAAGRNRPLRRAMEAITGIAAKRSLPLWQKPWRESGAAGRPEDVKGDGLDIVLLADTFNRYFEPENLAAATRVFSAAGYRIHHAAPVGGRRPLCCGRTYLSLGQIDKARAEAGRLASTLLPFVERGARIVGLEPSCLLTLRDEYRVLVDPTMAEPLAGAALLAEELLAADLAQGRITLPFRDMTGTTAHLHGHCHQKAAGVLTPVEACLNAIPGLTVHTIDSGCCGMAGSFGFQAETFEISRKMAELALLPAIRETADGDLIVADGTSCRHQIVDESARVAFHTIRLLDRATQLHV